MRDIFLSFVIFGFATLISSCTSRIETHSRESVSFPKLELNKNVNVKIICITERGERLCQNLLEKGAKRTSAPAHNSFALTLNNGVFDDLSRMRLCGIRSTTSDVIIKFDLKHKDDFSFGVNFLNYSHEEIRVSAHSIHNPNLPYSYPCEKRDGEILAKSLNEIFF